MAVLGVLDLGGLHFLKHLMQNKILFAQSIAMCHSSGLLSQQLTLACCTHCPTVWIHEDA